jgi:hypothetical protein
MPRRTGYTVYKNRRLLSTEELEILDREWLAGKALMSLVKETGISQRSLKLGLIALGYTYEPRHKDIEQQVKWDKAYKAAYDKNKRIKARLACLEYYGPRCACCAEDHVLLLTIDHINNDGAEDRKNNNLASMWETVVKREFPDTFQVLCMNCNWGKMRNNNICPHNAPYWIFSSTAEGGE